MSPLPPIVVSRKTEYQGDQNLIDSGLKPATTWPLIAKAQMKILHESFRHGAWRR